MTIDSTEFAPSPRADESDLARDRALLLSQPMLVQLIEAVPLYILFLNSERQIVLSNHPFQLFLGIQGDDSIFGRRPGEAVRCTHSYEKITGCGTTDFCSECGAVKAILASHENRPDVRECHILRENLDALELRVWAAPMTIAGRFFTFFAITDISDEKRRQSLERLCYHDIGNLVGGLVLSVDEWRMDLPVRSKDVERLELQGGLADRLLDEVRSHQSMLMAEQSELQPKLSLINGYELLCEVVGEFTQGKGRIVCHDETERASFTSDRILLGRIILNMIKNAVEADGDSGSVTARCFFDGDQIVFTIHNKTVISDEVRKQLFQRSFSTKGKGRGMGSYGMKLIAERYLGGSVWFTTHEGVGTDFFVALPKE